jgi:hypothetical protein
MSPPFATRRGDDASSVNAGDVASPVIPTATCIGPRKAAVPDGAGDKTDMSVSARLAMAFSVLAPSPMVS